MGRNKAYPPDAPQDQALRLDSLLFYLRFFKSRGLAATAIAKRGVRIDGRRTAKPSASVRPGSILTFARGNTVHCVQIDRLPVRRGPALEAQQHYRRVGDDTTDPSA